MVLQLINLRPGNADGRRWTPPFDQAVEYEHPHWWNRQLGDHTWFVRVLEGGAEVARIEFDDPGGINPEYANVPELGDDRLEIQFIEVATAARGRGIGTQLVQALERRHPSRRLFAYSEGADRFWTRLAWESFVHPAGGYRTLFIQPQRITSA